jgi:hypothetical protein
MKANLFFSFFLASISICWAGCKEKILKPAALEGYWLLENASREGQATTTLENSWLEFTKQAASTNLPIGIGESITYLTKDDQIILKGTGESAFQVLAMTDTTMQLAFQARGFEFNLFFRKGTRPEIEPIPAQPVEQ